MGWLSARMTIINDKNYGKKHKSYKSTFKSTYQQTKYNIQMNQQIINSTMTLENNRPKIMGALKKSQFQLGQRVH